MKSLFFGIVLILLLGVAGFFYRNILERDQPPPPVACTMEAKVCPDGSAVGRTGPSCEFTACPFPNAEDPDISLGFVVPEAYTANADVIGPDITLRAVFEKPSLSPSVAHTITVRRYAIAEGETADDVILAHTRYQPADMQAEDFSRFDTESIGGKTFRHTVIERFEGQIQSAYFLTRVTDVLMFEVIERDVVDWMEPTLSIKDLPEHAALRAMLGTITP